MYSSVQEFLKQPYPYYFKGKNLWILATMIFGMSMGFNNFFEPFVVYRPEHKVSYFWISMIHSLNAGQSSSSCRQEHLVFLGWFLSLVSGGGNG